ncbi:Urease accessory protein UreH, partial [Haemophilus influenzae]
LRKLEST